MGVGGSLSPLLLYAEEINDLNVLELSVCAIKQQLSIDPSYITAQFDELKKKVHFGLMRQVNIPQSTITCSSESHFYNAPLSSKVCCLLQLIKLDSQLHLINRLFTSISFMYWSCQRRESCGSVQREETRRKDEEQHPIDPSLQRTQQELCQEILQSLTNTHILAHTHHGAVFHTGPHTAYWHFFPFFPHHCRFSSGELWRCLQQNTYVI